MSKSKEHFTSRKREYEDYYAISTVPDTIRKGSASKYLIRKSIQPILHNSSLVKDLNQTDRYNMIERNKSFSKLLQKSYIQKLKDTEIAQPSFTSIYSHFPPTLKHFVWSHQKLNSIAESMNYHLANMAKFTEIIKNVKIELYKQMDSTFNSICRDSMAIMQFVQSEDARHKEELLEKLKVNRNSEEAMEKYKLETDKYVNSLITLNKAKDAEITHLKDMEIIMEQEVNRLREYMKKFDQIEPTVPNSKKEGILEQCKDYLSNERKEMGVFVDDLEQLQNKKAVMLSGMKNLFKQFVQTSRIIK